MWNSRRWDARAASHNALLRSNSVTLQSDEHARAARNKNELQISR